MTSLFMRIDGIDDFAGMATVEKIQNKSGFFPLDSYSIGFARSIDIKIGAVGDAEVGVPSVSDVVISRRPDNASSILASLFFSPGAKGRVFEILETKQATDGKGLIPVKAIKLEQARISSFDGSPGGNSFTIAFTFIEMAFWLEDGAGNVTKGSVVSYDLAKGQVKSAAPQVTGG